MMPRTRTEGPASSRPVRLVDQDHRPRSAAFSDLETMKITLHAGLAEPERVYEEPFRLGHFAHRQHRPVETTRGHIRADLLRGPAFPVVGGVLDDLQLQPGRMLEAHEGLPETLLDAAVRDLVPVQMIDPELRRSLRNRVGS